MTCYQIIVHLFKDSRVLFVICMHRVVYFFIIVLILEVKIKATSQVGSEGRINGLIEDLIEHVE